MAPPERKRKRCVYELAERLFQASSNVVGALIQTGDSNGVYEVLEKEMNEIESGVRSLFLSVLQQERGRQ